MGSRNMPPDRRAVQTHTVIAVLGIDLDIHRQLNQLQLPGLLETTASPCPPVWTSKTIPPPPLSTNQPTRTYLLSRMMVLTTSSYSTSPWSDPWISHARPTRRFLSSSLDDA